MLKFPGEFCGDKKADKIIKQYYNDRLTEMVRDMLLIYQPQGYEAIRENDMEFADYVNLLFPPNYPDNKMTAVYLGLYSLLTAEDEFIPEIIMEYLLDAIIRTNLEMWRDVGVPTVQEVPNREYVLQKLKEEYEGEEITGEEVLSRIEDLENYEEYCFWDIDFAMLDQMSVEELKQSNMNKELGIFSDKKENTFVIPPEWIKQGK